MPPPRPPRRSRKRVAWVAGIITLIAVLSALTLRTPKPAHIDLYSDGLAITSEGLVTLPPGSAATYLDGTRVLAPAASASAAEWASAQGAADAANAWLDSGTVPGEGTAFEDMSRGALLDLQALTGPDGALVAGPHPRWRYVWPRDNSFSAVALARTGHLGEAVRILEFLDRVQADDGGFEARYLTDGSGPPDDRSPQTDGTGWVLWGLGQVVDSAPEEQQPQLVEEFRPLLERSTHHILDLIDNPEDRPPPSPDYWEVRERTLTLGTAAPLLAGLEAAAELFAGVGDLDASDTASDGAVRLRAAIIRDFGPRGFPRHLTGGEPDTATAFLLPPFVSEPLPGAVEAWEGSVETMLRPAGGLAPGGSWRRDGISWTPETAIYALAAAHQGQRETAADWLTWLNTHRTGSGALAEKVLADGSPAAVAPLTWTSSTVLLALLELDSLP